MIRISVGKGVKAKKSKIYQDEFKPLVNRLEKLNTPGMGKMESFWISAPMDGDRSNANAQPCKLLMVDIDGATPKAFSDIENVLAGRAARVERAQRAQRAWIYTTYSHTPDNPKFRIILELGEAVSDRKPYLVGFLTHLNTLLGYKEVSRVKQLHRYAKGEDYYDVDILADNARIMFLPPHGAYSAFYDGDPWVGTAETKNPATGDSGRTEASVDLTRLYDALAYCADREGDTHESWLKYHLALCNIPDKAAAWAAHCFFSERAGGETKDNAKAFAADWPRAQTGEIHTSLDWIYQRALLLGWQCTSEEATSHLRALNGRLLQVRAAVSRTSQTDDEETFNRLTATEAELTRDIRAIADRIKPLFVNDFKGWLGAVYEVRHTVDLSGLILLSVSSRTFKCWFMDDGTYSDDVGSAAGHNIAKLLHDARMWDFILLERQGAKLLQGYTFDLSDRFAESRIRNGRLNTYAGMPFRPNPRPHPLVDEWLEKVVKGTLCSGREREFHKVMEFYARKIQRPQERLCKGIMFYGAAGAGKDLSASIFGALFGSAYKSVVDVNDIVGNFNDAMSGKLLINIQECIFPGDKKISSKIKGLMTSSSVSINRKYESIRDEKVYADFVMSDNSEHALHVDKGTLRRFLVLEVKKENVVPDCAKYAAILGDKAALGYLMYILDSYRVEKGIYDVVGVGDISKQGEYSLEGVDAFAWDLVRGLVYATDALIDGGGEAIDVLKGPVQSRVLYETYIASARAGRYGHFSGKSAVRFMMELKAIIGGETRPVKIEGKVAKYYFAGSVDEIAGRLKAEKGIDFIPELD